MNILTTEEKHRLLSDISTLRAHVIDVARKFDGAGQIISMCDAADDIVQLSGRGSSVQAMDKALFGGNK
jgi:hypothetical protein